MAPLPFWLTDPAPLEARKTLGHPEQDEDIESTEKDEEFGQQDADLRLKALRANTVFWQDLNKCRDVAGLYNCAVEYGIDVRMYPKLFFARLCYAGEPLAVLLSALEDVALGTPGNLNFLLDWELRRGDEKKRLREGIHSDDMILLQQWMRWQLHLGLKTEEDIFVFLRFVSRVSNTTGDEALRCSFVASVFEGLQSSSIFGFKDLGNATLYRLFESLTRGPVTRQTLDLGFRLIEAVQHSQLESTGQMISAFIGGVFHAYASLRENQKREPRFLEVIPRTLEMLGGLPQELACSVVLITTKALINDHFRMPAIKAATMQLLDTWWSALAKTDILEFRQKVPLKTEIELLLSTQKPEVAVPYLQHMDDRSKARFMLRYWVGPKTRSGRSRARYLFDGFCSAKVKDSPWVSMFQAARECAQESLEPSDVGVKQVFTVLQMLRKSESIVEIIKQARKLHAIIDETDVVYTIMKHLRTRPHLAERLFYFYPRLRLEKCPVLAERMILNPRIHPETALRYMRSRRTRFPVKREEFSQLRIQLLDRMALAYSMALHITPRMAFRNAYKCYTQHMKERLGPTSVVMARALTRAGIIQPLQAGQWVSTSAVRWILSIVRSTESADVVDRIDEVVYKWRGANARKARAVSLATGCARRYETKVSMSFRVRTKWSKHYRGYEKVYTPSKSSEPRIRLTGSLNHAREA